MNPERKLSSYIGAGWYNILMYALGLAALAITLFGGIAGRNADAPENALPFSPSVESGSGAYIDVIGVSEPLHTILVRSGDTTRNSYYCLAAAANGGEYIIRVNEEDMAALSLQQSGTTDRSVRVYGAALDIPESHLGKINASSHLPEGGVSAAVSGGSFLSVNARPSHIKGYRYMLIGGFFPLFICAGIAVVNFSIYKNKKRSLARLSAAGMLEKAARELDEPAAVYYNDACRISEHFIYGAKRGTALAVSDVLWAEKKSSGDRSPQRHTLTLHTCTGESYVLLSLSRSDSSDPRDLIIARLRSAVAGLISGSGEEAQQKYRQRLESIAAEQTKEN